MFFTNKLSRHRKLVSNFGYLSLLKIFEYVFPLLTVPYLARVLGVENFGLVAFAQAFITYFLIIVDYGFNLSATRDISVHRQDREHVSKVFCSVMLIKSLLCLLGFVVLLVIVLGFDRFRSDVWLYVCTYGLVVATVLFPLWLFQGLEEMQYITLVQFLSRLIFTIMIFLLVHSPADTILVPMLNSLGGIVAGGIALFIVFKKFHISLHWPKREEMKKQMRASREIFLANLSISLYTISNTFFLGLFWNDTVVGYYSGAEKILRPVQNMLQPITQAVYPHLSELASRSREEALAFIRKLVVLIGSLTLTISLVTFVLSPVLVRILLGPLYTPSIDVLRILSPLPFLIALSNIFGIQTMLSFGLNRLFSRIIIGLTVCHMVLLFLLMPYQQTGVSVAVLLTESFITFFTFFYLSKAGYNVSPLRRKRAANAKDR